MSEEFRSPDAPRGKPKNEEPFIAPGMDMVHVPDAPEMSVPPPVVQELLERMNEDPDYVPPPVSDEAELGKKHGEASE